ncbi:MAG: radical SAM/SPASM domain-containing protein [Candidatus Eisenbacteria bacterium]
MRPLSHRLMMFFREAMGSEFHDLESHPFLVHPFAVRTRFLWRRLLPFLSTRPVEWIVRGILRVLLAGGLDVAGLGGGASNENVRRFVGGLGPSKRVDLGMRILYRRGLRQLRRVDRLLEARKSGKEFLNLSCMTLSIGGSCNLQCSGCWSRSGQTEEPAPLEHVERVLREAIDADVSLVSIIGPGEPFLDARYARSLIDCIARHRELDALLFTNGTLIDEALAAKMSRAANLFVLVSVDGPERTNDRRRGVGTYRSALASMARLRNHQVPFGFSGTVYRENRTEITSRAFIGAMVEAGCLLGAYIDAGFAESACAGISPMTPRQREEYHGRVAGLRSGAALHLIEGHMVERDRYGCRARKGTWCHVDVRSGRVSPCLLFPHSSEECSLYRGSGGSVLCDILRGPFFTEYRRLGSDHRHCMSDREGELLALLRNPFLGRADFEEVSAILKYRTDRAGRTGVPVGAVQAETHTDGPSASFAVSRTEGHHESGKSTASKHARD